MSPDVADVCLSAEHAIELGELLELVGDCINGNPDAFADALGGFCGGDYTVEDLRADLVRFAFLLGGDGERFVSGDDR